ncbi:MAG: inner membrane protein YpjD [Candidatus Berkiella sp.]
MNLQTLSILSILSYLSVAFNQGLHLYNLRPFARAWYYIGSMICLLSHGIILYKLIDTPMGQNMDWLIMLSFTMWLMNLFSLGMSLHAPMMQLSILTYPLSAITLGLSLSLHQDVLSKTEPSALIHIFISLFAMSILTLASFLAILLAMQNTLIKKHRAYLILRILPPLQSMEGLLFVILWSALVFLTASLGSGFFFQSTHFTHIAYPKTILAVFAWISLVLLLGGRLFFGWRGPTAIRWTLSSAIFAVLSYFGTKALLL